MYTKDAHENTTQKMLISSNLGALHITQAEHVQKVHTETTTLTQTKMQQYWQLG